MLVTAHSSMERDQSGKDMNENTTEDFIKIFYNDVENHLKMIVINQKYFDKLGVICFKCINSSQ